MRCLMEEFSNVLNTYTNCNGSTKITVQVQLTVLKQSASCIIFIPQAPNMSLKTSNTDTAWLALLHLPILLICHLYYV